MNNRRSLIRLPISQLNIRRGVMIMTFWQYVLKSLILHRTTGFLPISKNTAYYDNAVNKNLKRKNL